MPLLAALLAPLTRRAIYPSGSTRTPPEGTNLHLVVGRTDLRGWVVNPGQERAVVYFGGNGEAVEELRSELARHLPGHSSYLLAYRGYGASGGRPSEAALVRDALALHDHVARRHPRYRVDVIGRSLGSGVAVQLAARRSLERLVLITPFDSLTAVAADHVRRLPVRMLVPDRFDSAALAPGLSVPTLVVRAGRDDVVRPDRTDHLLEQLRAETEVLLLPEADHAAITSRPPFWPTLRRFLEG